MSNKMSNSLYTRNNIWFYTCVLGFGFTIVYNIIKNNNKITKINEKLGCILDNQLRFIKLLNYNEKYDNNNKHNHCLNEVKDEVKGEAKDEAKNEVKDELKDDNIDKEYLDDNIDKEYLHDNIDKEYLDDNYDNVPFITKSKYFFKFW